MSGLYSSLLRSEDQPMRTSARQRSSDLLKLAETEGLPEETVALLKILAMRQREVDRGQLLPAAEVFERVRAGLSRKPT